MAHKTWMGGIFTGEIGQNGLGTGFKQPELGKFEDEAKNKPKPEVKSMNIQCRYGAFCRNKQLCPFSHDVCPEIDTTDLEHKKMVGHYAATPTNTNSFASASPL